MKISKLKIKNFYSFKDASVDFADYSGLTLIKGKNKDTGGSNGAGKSALVEALFFGLTGKTIRKSTEDSLVNNQAKKKCEIRLEILHKDKEVVITRQKKPTKLELMVGKENRTKDTVAATQKEIDSFLNINHKVLLASMFFGQSNDLNFLDCTPEDKRTIIRNFLNLDDMFKMRDKIKSHKSVFYQRVKEKDAVIQENNKTIEGLDEKIEDIEKAKESYSSYSEEVLSLSLEEVLEGERLYHQKQLEIQALRHDLVDIQKEIRDKEMLLKNPEKPEICSKCDQPILVKKLDPLSLKERVKFLKKTIKELKETIQREEGLNPFPLISSVEFVKVLDYKNLCRDETNYEDLKKERLTSIAEAEEDKSFSKTWYEVMRFWEKAFSEQGVVKHIINNVLSYFNDQCNFYLSYLTNSKYFVEFDQELTEKIETDGRLIQYISLSGGEKRKINLAIMLGLKDLLLLTDKSHVDLLFFDEVAENIDEEGVTGLHQLLQQIKKNKTIFVITHNKYLKTLLDSSRRLSIIKHKGLSKVEA